MNIQEILQKATDAGAADIFLIAGLPVTFKCNGRQERLDGDRMMGDSIGVLVDEIYALSGRDRGNLE